MDVENEVEVNRVRELCHSSMIEDSQMSAGTNQAQFPRHRR